MWLAVNYDGTEVSFNICPGRFSDYIKQWNEIDRAKGVPDSELYQENDDKYRYWTDESSNYLTEIYDGIEAYNTCVYLPKGTIKFLTGKTITWDDEPIEINELEK